MDDELISGSYDNRKLLVYFETNDYHVVDPKFIMCPSKKRSNLFII